jgi:hypothetical protein
MTTRAEKIRKLRALGRSPNKHEAALALQKARELESRTPTAKGIALAIVALLEGRGFKARARRYKPDGLPPGSGPAFDVEIDYRTSQAKVFRPRHQLKISIVEYDAS